jgi:hypothetical protein
MAQLTYERFACGKAQPNMKATNRRLPAFAHLLIAITALWGLGARWAAGAETPPGIPGRADKNYALLVGCTQYRYCTKVRELFGPRNDVPMFARLLEQQFGFDRDRMQILVDWPEDEAARPTFDNIVAAFEELIAKAEQGSQVVIFMSGHGTQVPDETDGTEENDGLDEVFLPADVRPWSDNDLPHAIRDDQFGKWFDALRNKGAHVWVVFDCCHSGTMTKAVGDAERMRTAQAADLDIPSTAFRQEDTGTNLTPQRAIDVAQNSAGGSLTEFYAAQSFEEAPELPRPADATRSPENYYGLFTYILIQVLEQRKAAMTYADLSRAIVNGYRAERGSRSPTPFFAGDLNREVLGVNYVPRSDRFSLQEAEGEYRLAAGEIHGITAGSILSIVVDPSAGPDEGILGYVRATEVSPTSSLVEPCDYDGRPAIALKQISKDAQCRLVVRDIGDMRVKLAVRHSADNAASRLNQHVDRALGQLPAEIQALVDTKPAEDTAQWLLHVVSPREAMESYRREIEEPVVALVNVRNEFGGPAGDQSRVWTTYQPESIDETELVDEISAQLANDLQKIFTWQNVWRVAVRAGASTESDFKLDVTRLNARQTRTAADDPNVLMVGDRISIKLTNEGIDDWWITLLHLNPHFGIKVWITESIAAKGTFGPRTINVKGKSLGPDGLVLLATPMASERLNPDYKSLEQTPLGEHGVFRNLRGAPLTPFGRLLAGAATGRGMRGLALEAPDQPQVLMRSWITLPAADSAIDRQAAVEDVP